MSELLKINVNDHTEKKGGLTYLSWAWAWAEVLKADPAATWVVHQYGSPGSEQPCMWIGETAMVHTSVTINEIRRECMLPVMDNRNNAVKLPDARKISDAIMRCMTKAIAMHGLGLYIYAGEDLPQVDGVEPEQEKLDERTAELNELSLYLIDCHQNGKDLDAIRLWYDPATWSADNPTEAEERKYVWGQLREFSKLRSTIKADHPKKAAA
jgi:hypothetical protein